MYVVHVKQSQFGQQNYLIRFKKYVKLKNMWKNVFCDNMHDSCVLFICRLVMTPGMVVLQQRFGNNFVN